MGGEFLDISLSLHRATFQAKKSLKLLAFGATLLSACCQNKFRTMLEVLPHFKEHVFSVKCWVFLHLHGGYESDGETLTGSTLTLTSSLALCRKEVAPASCTHPAYLFLPYLSLSFISSSVFHCLSLPLLPAPLHPGVSVSCSSPNFLSISFLCVNSLKSIMRHTDSLISWIK